MQMARSQLILILLFAASDEVHELLQLPLVYWFCSEDNSREGSFYVLSVDMQYLLLSETACWADGSLLWSGMTVPLYLYGCEHCALYSS